jgi:hypothetical protein
MGFGTSAMAQAGEFSGALEEWMPQALPSADGPAFDFGARGDGSTHILGDFLA